jgi:hypothetical protein
MVKCTPELMNTTFRLFVPPFPGDSRNTALTVIVVTTVCTRPVILDLTVKPPIIKGVHAREDHSATTPIHEWIQYFSF